MPRETTSRWRIARREVVKLPSRVMPQRQHYLFVCTNRRPEGNPKGSCAASGSEEVYRLLKNALAQKDLAKVQARACSCSCLDVCHTGPTIVVEPDHFAYGRVRPEDVPEIVEALGRGERVERLVLQAHEFDDPSETPT